MTKTFALVLYLVFNDGSSQDFIADSGLAAGECAARMVEFAIMDGVPVPAVPFKGARRVEGAFAVCEEETNV